MASVKDEFFNVVQRLGMSAGDQERYLEELGTAPAVDELALEYDDVFGVIRDTLDANARKIADELDQLLSERSGPEYIDFWTTSSLAEHLEWEAIRHKARELLNYLS